MFVIEVNYIKPLYEVETQLHAHREYLDKYLQAGVLFASGPKVPRTGGVILTRDISRPDLDKLISGDPFHRHKLAEYVITEFEVTKKAETPL